MKALLKSLAEFQQEVPVIHEDTKGYNYTYANLTTIFKTIKPILKHHGLGFYQLLDGENLNTSVFHIESGEELKSVVKINYDVNLNSMNAYQVAGSAITYFRRYSLSCILGLITDKDIDAEGEEVKPPVKKAPEKKASAKPNMTKDIFDKVVVGSKEGIESALKAYTISPESELKLSKALEAYKK